MRLRTQARARLASRAARKSSCEPSKLTLATPRKTAPTALAAGTDSVRGLHSALGPLSTLPGIATTGGCGCMQSSTFVLVVVALGLETVLVESQVFGSRVKALRHQTYLYLRPCYPTVVPVIMCPPPVQDLRRIKTEEGVCHEQGLLRRADVVPGLISIQDHGQTGTYLPCHTIPALSMC